MKIAVTGSRTLAGNKEKRQALINELAKHDCKLLISGGAKGPDFWAEEYATANGIKCLIITPDYEAFGKQAPLIRNLEIVNECEILISVWDGQSRGTAHTVQRARMKGKTVIEI